MADKTVLASLVSRQSSQSRYLCTQDRYACFGADRAELAIALIGGSRSPEAGRRLVALSRFQIGDGLSEDLHCEVSLRGKALLPLISAARPEALARQCESEFTTHRKRSAVEYDAALAAVCRNPQQIREALDEFAALARAPGGCEE